MRLTLTTVLVLGAAVAVTGCGNDDEQVGGSAEGPDATASVATTADAETAERASTADDVDAFCAAIAVMDTHDGTTEASVAVAAIEDARGSAPAAIRDDMDLLADTLIANNYPNEASPSITAAPLDRSTPASERLAGFVEQHCDADR